MPCTVTTMSILVENSFGWVLSHEKALDEIYSHVFCGTYNDSCSTDKSGAGVRFKTDLFNIFTPFKMDSQRKTESVAATEAGASEEDEMTARKRKRKRREPLNDGEMAAIQFHEEIQDRLQKSLSSLICLAQEKGYLKDAVPESRGDNNNLSRTAAVITGPAISLIDQCIQKQERADKPTVRVFNQGKVSCENPVGTVWQFTGEKTAVVNILSEKYLLPPRCTFLLSDLSGLQQYFQELGKYDLIVIDPPWQNKSAKRLKKYWAMKNEELLGLPVPGLVDDNSCLIIIWATNKQAQLQFIQDTLFPAWGVHFMAHWFWLKVTKSGEPVYNMDSPHKKPYESIIIGCHCKDDSNCQHKTIPREKVVISVPCSLHSKKPPLCDVLKPYLPNEPRCLELFARNLWPGWTSWGNEVLLHQHINFFEPVT